MAADKKKLVGRILGSEEGTSIVSVIAAFVLLLMGISMFYAAILASQRMADKAEQINLASQQELEQYYEESFLSQQEPEQYYEESFLSQQEPEQYYEESSASQQNPEQLDEEGSASGERTEEEMEYSVISLREIDGNDRISVRIPSSVPSQ